MHLIAWIGFDAEGTPIGHDGPLTVIPGPVCVGSAALGLRLADVQHTLRGPVAAGAVMAGDVVGAHAPGMAAVNPHAGVHSSAGAALVSALLSAVGTTAARWLTVPLGAKAKAAGASLLIGSVLCSAQYTDLTAVTVGPGAGSGQGGGPGGAALTVPLATVLVLVVLTVAFNPYITPVQDVHDAPAQATSVSAHCDEEKGSPLRHR
ncbi:hypothetical protein [Streptomyces sp. NPDC002265]|uniref:hypothetical protein n=1 Tax=Streptomyces sp. NPDC002265 TaxID=3154415 RepID=UPI0033261092